MRSLYSYGESPEPKSSERERSIEKESPNILYLLFRKTRIATIAAIATHTQVHGLYPHIQIQSTNYRFIIQLKLNIVLLLSSYLLLDVVL